MLLLSEDASSVRLYPDNFRGASLNQDTCTVKSFGEFLCLSSTTLLDGNTGPNRPDITSASDLGHFAAWSHQHTPLDTLYLSVRQRPPFVHITAIDIYVLNYPRERIGVPNFLTLYGTPDQSSQQPFDVTGVDVVTLSYDLVNNDLLSQSDSRVRRITLRLRESSRNRRYVITWNFSGLYSVEWLLVSEVQLCTSTQPAFPPAQVQFLNPAADAPKNIQPNAAVLKNRFLELMCMVSNQGSFNWVWTKGMEELSSNSKTMILSADGTRTSVLRISEIRFQDYGKYTCNVTYNGSVIYTARQKNILFPCKISFSSLTCAVNLNSIITANNGPHSCMQKELLASSSSIMSFGPPFLPVIN